MIFDLHFHGLSNQEIVNYLNANELVKPISQTPYKTKDVWSVLHKLQQREKRKTDTLVNVGSWKIVF